VTKQSDNGLIFLRRGLLRCARKDGIRGSSANWQMKGGRASGLNAGGPFIANQLKSHLGNQRAISGKIITARIAIT
jgi:hypothetical protein